MAHPMESVRIAGKQATSVSSSQSLPPRRLRSYQSQPFPAGYLLVRLCTARLANHWHQAQARQSDLEERLFLHPRAVRSHTRVHQVSRLLRDTPHSRLGLVTILLHQMILMAGDDPMKKITLRACLLQTCMGNPILADARPRRLPRAGPRRSLSTTTHRTPRGTIRATGLAPRAATVPTRLTKQEVVR